MYETVLVADDGLLAVRVIRSLQRLGVKAVALGLAGDTDAPHRHAADEVQPFGPTPPEEFGRALMEAAAVSGAQAVHPGGSALTDDPGALAGELWAGGVDWLGPMSPLRPLTVGDHGVTVVGGRVVDGWRWLRAADGTAVGALAETPAAELVAAAAELAEPVGSVVRDPTGRAVSRGGLVAVDRLAEVRTGVDLVAARLRAATAERDRSADDGVGPAVGAAVSVALRAPADETTVSGLVLPDVDGVVVDTVLADGRRLAAGGRDPVVVLTAAGADLTVAVDRLRTALSGLVVGRPVLDPTAARAVLDSLG